MDEPTNDLDVETLGLLEDLVADYAGTLLLVSHDREFLDNVVTSTLVFEGAGRGNEYVGGYSDWLRQRKVPAPPRAMASTASAAPAAAVAATAARAAPKRRRLSHHEQLEIEALPARIQTLEAEQGRLQSDIGDPQLFRARDQPFDERAQPEALRIGRES